MPPRKRKAVDVVVDDDGTVDDFETPVASSSRRRSTRVSSSGGKSQYFESQSDSEDASTPEQEAAPKRGRGRPKGSTNATTKANGKAKGLAKGQAKKAKRQASEDEEDAYVSEGENENEADDDDDDEADDDAPPKTTFIPHIKLRPDLGIPYMDKRIHENTLLFLKDLKRHNQRSWLKAHDAEFRRSLTDWQTWAESMTERIMEHDETIPELPFKDINFRIYRDIRFSNDPTPYKPHYSAAWSRTGRKGPYACYYIHMEPGNCFVAAGLWGPDANAMAKLRASIDEQPRRWRRLLSDRDFSLFLPDAQLLGSASKEQKEARAIDAFCRHNHEGALKTKPKGFNADHRDIELLKLRRFTLRYKLNDNWFLSEMAQEELGSVIQRLVKFVTHLNRIVMPDPNDDDDEDDESDEEGEED